MASTMCDASTQTGDPKPVETETPHEELQESGEAAAHPAANRTSRRERRRMFWKPIHDKIHCNREQKVAAGDLQIVTSDSSILNTSLPMGQRTNQGRSNNIFRQGGRGGPGSRHNSSGRGGGPGSSFAFEVHTQGESRYLARYYQSYGSNPGSQEYSQQVDQYMRPYPPGWQLQQATALEWPYGTCQFTSYSQPSQRSVPQVLVSSHIEQAPLIDPSLYHDGPLSQKPTNDKGNKPKLGGLTVSTEHDLMKMSSRTPLIIPAGDLDLEDPELEAECSQIDAVIPVTESSNLVPRGQEVDWDGRTKVAPHPLEEAQPEVILGKEDTLPRNEALEERMQLVKKLVAAGETRLAAALRSQSLSPTSDHSNFSVRIPSSYSIHAANHSQFTDDSTVVDEPQELPVSDTLLQSQRWYAAKKIGFDSPCAPRSFSEDQLYLSLWL